ncbi:hypothetical protein KJK34_07080 [Flavobacterium sp. D11R37]|uniref:hypothetical protein n=1 Tax=Flavobacterium coralii TaxID=2838017 RepID=UPI001CA72E4B|nr:hypothetical protein [Flavobacterium coralii]MBY8962512.1 hypothetical protein [Flavobacterium coralii]
MAINENDKREYDTDGRPDRDVTRTNQNTGLKNDAESLKTGNMLPEDDPAVINPDELASFPEEKRTTDPDLEEERDSHLANKVRGSVREGRNITNTDTKPDDNGFL